MPRLTGHRLTTEEAEHDERVLVEYLAAVLRNIERLHAGWWAKPEEPEARVVPWPPTGS